MGRCHARRRRWRWWGAPGGGGLRLNLREQVGASIEVAGGLEVAGLVGDAARDAADDAIEDRLPLVDGVELCSDRNGLLLGLGLARRTMAAALRAMTYPRREPPPSETRPGDGDDWDLDVDLGNWPASGAFALARVGAGGELVDLTNADLGLWEILLGLDYILNR